MSQRRKVYLFLGRAVSPVAVAGLKLYTKLTKRPRVRVLVENEKGEILLIRNVLSNGDRWMLPGGGVSRKETFADAASRELHEETGINIPASKFLFVGIIKASESGLMFDVPVFRVRAKSTDLPQKLFNPKEIVDVRWFASTRLPEHTSELVQYLLDTKE